MGKLLKCQGRACFGHWSVCHRLPACEWGMKSRTEAVACTNQCRPVFWQRTKASCHSLARLSCASTKSNGREDRRGCEVRAPMGLGAMGEPATRDEPKKWQASL